MAGMRKTLRIAEFRALLISYVINRAGDVFGALALAVVVLGTTKSAIAVAALFLATQFVPGLVGPFLVARIGALPSGRVLPLCYLVEACLFLVLAAVARHVGVALILVLALVDGTLAFAGRSVTRATTASTLMPHDLMPEGKAAFNLALAVATVAGPVLGGAVIALARSFHGVGGRRGVVPGGGDSDRLHARVACADRLRSGPHATVTVRCVRACATSPATPPSAY